MDTYSLVYTILLYILTPHAIFKNIHRTLKAGSI
jgi:hypothetical protein